MAKTPQFEPRIKIWKTVNDISGKRYGIAYVIVEMNVLNKAN